jgi:transcriptional regulator with XRE-family HTH domain
LNDLPYKIKSYRLSLGMTQKQLGEKAGIAQEFISEIESGKKKPSLEVLENLCGALGCSADYLLGINGPKRLSSVKEEGASFALSPELLAEIAQRHLTEDDLRLALKVAVVMRDEKRSGS